MPGFEEILVIGGLGVGAVLLVKPELITQFFPSAVTPSTTESVPQAVATTPTVSQIVATPDILVQANVAYLIPIRHCDLDDILDTDADAFAVVKIWEQSYNQIATTIVERNILVLKRCDILHWYRSIDIDFPFSDPIREHIRRTKLVIIDDFHRGQRDSPAANSAAHQAAQVTTPITVDCKNCTVNIQNQVAVQQQQTTQAPPSPRPSAGPPPGANTPPIHPAASVIGQGGASTKPTTITQCPHGQAWSASTMQCVSNQQTINFGSAVQQGASKKNVVTQQQSAYARSYYGRRF